MNKFEKDLSFGQINRLEVAAKISKNGLSLRPVHPHLDISFYPISTKKQRNTLINRLIDMGTSDGMGLDYILTHKNSTKKIKTIIRWFSDPEIFIKGVSDADIIPCYSDAILLFVNQPLKENKGLQYYRLIHFSDLKKLKFKWINNDRGGSNNKNRIILVNNANHLVIPKTLDYYPIKGDRNLFSTIPDIHTSLKFLFQ